MLNKLLTFARQHDMLRPGEEIICAVSGGADSVALLFGMYLLREKLGITVSAAHFNHHLRGEESNRDERFVREFCARYDIPLAVGEAQVVSGEKGLEAAARDARYGFLKTLPGKIATAHTADDNAETVLMHMVRGTGLRGLGGIAPVNGSLIRPMLTVTRNEVLAFLQEYNLTYIQDSSNDTDDFLRNRLRHHVMPLLVKENPAFSQNTSGMALRLREDEKALADAAEPVSDVDLLRQMHPALRSRALGALLRMYGVKESEAQHIALAESLVFSEKPSAAATFPNGVTLKRNYRRLEKGNPSAPLSVMELSCPGSVELPELGLRAVAVPAEALVNTKDVFTVRTEGQLILRGRQEGDILCRSGGSKSLKKLFIDKKIPAAQRSVVPVIADDRGIVGVYGFGADKNRMAETLPAVQIRFESLTE